MAETSYTLVGIPKALLITFGNSNNRQVKERANKQRYEKGCALSSNSITCYAGIITRRTMKRLHETFSYSSKRKNFQIFAFQSHSKIPVIDINFFYDIFVVVMYICKRSKYHLSIAMANGLVNRSISSTEWHQKIIRPKTLCHVLISHWKSWNLLQWCWLHS